MHHFILTRFCLNLWKKDKNGLTIDRREWIKRRLELFERYTLPSIMRQRSKDFEWLLLVSATGDGHTDSLLKDKLAEYKEKCPQIKVVNVNPQYSWRFGDIFGKVVRQRLADIGAKADELCLTTYFDNDDMMHPEYVERVRQYAVDMQVGTFLAFDYGIQYFEEMGRATRIFYPNNHFLSLVEECGDVRTCYGYGSHFLLERNHVARVKHIKDRKTLMWVEVIHEGNVDNDVKMTWDTSVLRSGDMKPYAVDIQGGWSISLIIRCMQQIIRRAKEKVVPRQW